MHLIIYSFINLFNGTEKCNNFMNLFCFNNQNIKYGTNNVSIFQPPNINEHTYTIHTMLHVAFETCFYFQNIDKEMSKTFSPFVYWAQSGKKIIIELNKKQTKKTKLKLSYIQCVPISMGIQ